MVDPNRVILSALLALVVGALGFRQEALTGGGWAAAVLVGTLTAGLGGWDWGLLVIVFFVTSSGLSRLGGYRKARVAADHWQKSERRDWGQVLANGGLVSALAVLWWLRPAHVYWAGAVGVLATVTGDTWATEVGVLSGRPPRLITTGRPVGAGTSGGVSALGSAAAAAGALCIGLAAVLFGWTVRDVLLPSVLPAAIVGGFVGVMFDSLLGATVQAMRWCPQCKAETERRRHGCGVLTSPLRGWSWLGNDAVNLLASGIGGLSAALIASL